MSKLVAKRVRRPHFDQLEKRDVPATWGIAWPEAGHLTLSFMPDGSQIGNQSSQLFRTLDNQLGANQWEGTILNALDTWADTSNINIGVVADNGQPLGTPGAPQGDPRFGDIRVGAAPLPSGVMAITAPYDPGTGTISGDVILNSNGNFNPQSGYDLFTVMLHESGHIFGFADSSDKSSFMYNVYSGKQTSLSSSAVTALQNLYGGPRNILALTSGTASSDSARPLDLSTQIQSGASPINVTGDLSSATPANYVQFQVPSYSQAPLGLDVQIQTGGISQLLPQMTVTNSAGTVVAQATSTSSSDGTITLHLDPSGQGGLYKIKINSSATDFQATGSYDLSVRATSFSDSVGVTSNKATALKSTASTSAASLSTVAGITATRQEDLYSFVTPSIMSGSLFVQLQVNGIGLASSQFEVWNKWGVKLATTTVANSQSPVAGATLNSLAPNTTYYVKVNTGTINAYQVGCYQLTVKFNQTSPCTPTMAVIQSPIIGSDVTKLAKQNTSLKDAAPLATPTGFVAGTYYTAIAGLSSSAASQYYSLKAPVATSTSYMTLAIQAINGSSLAPWVSILDASGTVLPHQVLLNSNGVDVLQVAYTGSPTLMIRVASSMANGGGTTGNYYLNATFATVGSALTTVASGSLGTQSPGMPTIVTPATPTLFLFTLTGDDANAGTDAILRVTVTDSAGKVVATLTSVATEASSMALMMTDSSYAIYVDACSPSGASVSGLRYALAGMELTDPIRTYPASGSGTSGTRS